MENPTAQTPNQPSEQKDSATERQLEKLQTSTARFAAVSAFLLAVSKLVIALITSSMSLLASALDSIMDVAASTINYYSIRQSLKPADYNHPYGHGKLESLAGLLQGQLMIASALYVIYSAVAKMGSPTQVERIGIGIAVMLVSTLVSIFIYRRLNSVGKKTNSLALQADSLHYGSDALSNLGVMVSLILVKYTGWMYIDLVVSILVSLYIVYAAGHLVKEAIDILMDKVLDDDKIEKIHNTILAFKDVESYHHLRTRQAANRLFVEFHLVAPRLTTFAQAHELAKQLTNAIIENFDSEVEVNIHMDPENDEGQNEDVNIKGISSVSWDTRHKNKNK